jgi:ABC-2 type transport system ATP-binding protein
VLGRAVKATHRTVRELGVVFGQRTQLWWDLPVIESFDLLRASSRARTRYRRLNELVGLLAYAAARRAGAAAQPQPACLRPAASLLHSPQLLFLDEPPSASTQSRSGGDFITSIAPTRHHSHHPRHG